MKVVAINGSVKKEGNTAALINMVFEELKKEGIETEMLHLSEAPIRGCRGCFKCFENKDKQCIIKNDKVNEYISKMDEADGVILASPTYFANVSTDLKAIIERAGLVGIGNDYLFKRKVGAAVVAVRRGGAVPTFNAINQFFTINQMIIPGSSYWNFGFGLQPGEVADDEEGVRTMKHLGENMAWLLKKIG